jgi:AcrR family transcriptional regulator
MTLRSEKRLAKTAVVGDFRRRQILSAARERFARRGVAATTVDEIARSAGMAKGTVYLYYRSKDRLLQSLVGEDLEELAAATVPTITGPGSIAERLERFFGATLSFFEARRDFFEQCQLGMDPQVRRKVRQRLGLVFAEQAQSWREVLTVAHRRREISISDPAGAAETIVCLAHGLALHQLKGWTAPTAPAAARLAWQGLVSR